MRIRTIVASLAVLFSAVFMPTSAAAQSEPCPPGQPFGRLPGTPPNAPGLVARPPQYPPGKCQLLLSRSVVAAGETVGVAGDGFAPGVAVAVRAAGVNLATVNADSGGSFSTDVVIPRSMAAGSHEVRAAGAAAGGGDQVLSASLTVTEPGGRSSTASGLGDALPRTGGGDGIGPLSAAATVLLVAGAAAVVATRRRATKPRA